MIKCSELIASLADVIDRYGDLEVKIGILTENGDWQYPLDKCFIGEQTKNNNKYYEVTLDIEDVKEFKKEIK